MSFTGGGVGRRGACTQKKRYETEREAWKSIRDLVEKGAYGPSLKVKRCPYGKRDHFHVAHWIAKGRKGKRS